MIVLMTYVAFYTIKATIGGICKIIKTVFSKPNEEPVVITKEEWEEIKKEMKELKDQISPKLL